MEWENCLYSYHGLISLDKLFGLYQIADCCPDSVTVLDVRPDLRPYDNIISDAFGRYFIFSWAEQATIRIP